MTQHSEAPKQRKALASRKQRLGALVLGFVMALGLVSFVACAPQSSTGENLPSTAAEEPSMDFRHYGGSAEGYEYMNTTDAVEEYSKHLKDWTLNDNLTDLIPVVVTLEDGTQIQKVPSDFSNRFAQPDFRNGTEVHNIEGFNNLMFNADNRGCTSSCHSLEEAMANESWYHFSAFLTGYNTEQTVQTCKGCHSEEHEVGSVPFKDAMHTLHYSNAAFNAMEGDCQSCHYIDWGGEYKLWDEVKYDLFTGVTDVPADTAAAEFSFDQTTITDRDDLWFKTSRLAQKDMPTDADVSQEDQDNWVIKVDGDVDQPFEMTLKEMTEQFGTKTEVFATACTETGVAAGTVGNVEVEGIPLSAIIEYAKPQAGADAVVFAGVDTYANNWGPSLEDVLKYDGVLVTKMNGDILYAEQGYPVRYMSQCISAGNAIKQVQEIHIVNTQKENSEYAIFGTYGVYKPLSGVLSAYDGQIFPAGQPIHLEGYSYAFDEPISKVEFSFDGGETWKTYETPNTEPGPWVYWKLDLSNEFTEKGAYLVKVKATSLQADGTETPAPAVTNFLVNVR
ncbi:molybdopterin-dependent oxidoreductase [Adlercreutzia sp. R25]|uniref:molybdopterin-dependent oxidoreductase n=1 Tax=Adlercreutzia shanghongiae TaxID=3111773 RepID=UPI002DB58A8A|nr:molybdopterin-dependent oxidoreductase [Adlercreutzia sp. R25]MEC4271885.1 molybdopterin-dependent oxidoreductase [Adlercreutzia sp. R25]